jgi:hypothetical protein
MRHKKLVTAGFQPSACAERDAKCGDQLSVFSGRGICSRQAQQGTQLQGESLLTQKRRTRKTHRKQQQ